MRGADPTTAGVEPALAHALADELVAITGMLADLAYDLAARPETLRHHMHSLQDIDRITQAQIAIADLLRSSATTERRLEVVTLEALGASIGAALGRYRREGLPTEPDIDEAA